MLVGVVQGVSSSLSGSEIDELRKQLQDLRQENAELKQRLSSQSNSIDGLIHRLEVLERRPSSVAPAPERTASADHAAMAPAAGGAAAAKPALNLRWYGDVNFRAGGKQRTGNDLPHTFSLGQLDLMAHSQLAERFSVMSEVVFQYRENEAAATTIERLQFQYHASDMLNLRFGRMHTPFGYWNESFHHGTWFQTTALRPDLLRFHDGGSVLPIHSVGLEAYGYRSLPAVDVHYTVGVANGRPLLFSDTVDAQDVNNHKAVYGVLSFSPAAISGLRLGVNGYVDAIAPDPSNRLRTARLDELITGAHAVFLRDHIEFLAEAMRIQHEHEVTGKTFTTWGTYVQASYQAGALKPYLRFDRLEVANDDPYYGAGVLDTTRYTAGMRWDFINWAALKFEYQYVRQPGIDRRHGVHTQATFTF